MHYGITWMIAGIMIIFISGYLSQTTEDANNTFRLTLIFSLSYSQAMMSLTWKYIWYLNQYSLITKVSQCWTSRGKAPKPDWLEQLRGTRLHNWEEAHSSIVSPSPFLGLLSLSFFLISLRAHSLIVFPAFLEGICQVDSMYWYIVTHLAPMGCWCLCHLKSFRADICICALMNWAIMGGL